MLIEMTESDFIHRPFSPASEGESCSGGRGNREELNSTSGATKEKPRNSARAEGETAVAGVMMGSISVNSRSKLPTSVSSGEQVER